MYQGNKVRLRAPKESDLPQIVDYVNDYETYSSFTDSAPLPKTEEFQATWLKTANRQDMITFAIESLNQGEFLGTIQLRNIDLLTGRSDFSIILKSGTQGQGYGTDALNTLLGFAFRELNLHKISLVCYESNLAAQKLYEKCGFIFEGTLREEIYRQGKYENQRAYSILQREWREHED